MGPWGKVYAHTQGLKYRTPDGSLRQFSHIPRGQSTVPRMSLWGKVYAYISDESKYPGWVPEALTSQPWKSWFFPSSSSSSALGLGTSLIKGGIVIRFEIGPSARPLSGPFGLIRFNNGVSTWSAVTPGPGFLA